MLDMGFASSYFDLDCFTAAVGDAKAGADTTIRFGALSGRTVLQSLTRPIDDYGPSHGRLWTHRSLGWPAITEHYER